jgi:flagellar hook-basal body complex protein FliE
MAVDPVSPLRVQPPASPTTAAAPAGGGFAAALGQLMSSTDAAASGANEAVSGMLHGTGDVHDAMIAMQRAQSTLELTIQVRNKLVAAYQEIMRMPV